MGTKTAQNALEANLGIVMGSAPLVASFERGAQEGNIETLPDALWWAATTVTTVGYGDRFPVTAPGRGIAVALMIVGIALFGFLAGSLASFFVEHHEEEQFDPQMAEIAKRLERIERALELTVRKVTNMASFRSSLDDWRAYLGT